MKSLIRKGFTIVELVIVIAVIAILAGVLIPTFSGIVDKANQNAALQTARSTLTNALNMSSTAQLQGEDTNGYHTVFIVDGYAFGYTGNELKATNYPDGGTTAKLTSGARYENNLWTKNFNAIAVAADNLVEIKYTSAEADTYNAALTGAVASGAAVPADYQTKVNEAAAGTTLTELEAKKYNRKLTGAVDENTTKGYALSLAISKVIASACDFEALASDATVGYTVTKTDGSYTVTSGTKSAALYINSDFSKSVVVFTTFAN